MSFGCGRVDDDGDGAAALGLLGLPPAESPPAAHVHGRGGKRFEGEEEESTSGPGGIFFFGCHVTYGAIPSGEYEHMACMRRVVVERHRLSWLGGD
jgi:hypothetical protein